MEPAHSGHRGPGGSLRADRIRSLVHPSVPIGLFAFVALGCGAAPSEAPPLRLTRQEVTRIVRVETGIEPWYQLRGYPPARASLTDRMAHHRERGLGVALLEGGRILWIRAYGTGVEEAEVAVTAQGLLEDLAREPPERAGKLRFGRGPSGASTVTAAFPETGQGAVILLPGDGAGVLAKELLSTLAREYGWPEALAPTPLREREVEPEERARLGGRWTAPDRGIRLDVDVSGARIRVGAPGQAALEYAALGSGVFLEPNSGSRLRLDGDRLLMEPGGAVARRR